MVSRTQIWCLPHFGSGRASVSIHSEATPAIADESAQAEALELARIGVATEDLAQQGAVSREAAAVAAEQLFDG